MDFEKKEYYINSTIIISDRTRIIFVLKLVAFIFLFSCVPSLQKKLIIPSFFLSFSVRSRNNKYSRRGRGSISDWGLIFDDDTVAAVYLKIRNQYGRLYVRIKLAHAHVFKYMCLYILVRTLRSSLVSKD